MKNPTIATLLNFIPGLGYIYVGGKRKVFGVLLLAAIVMSVVTGFDPALSSYVDPNAEFDVTVWTMAGILSLILGMAAFMYDGYIAAVAHNSSISKKKK